MKNILFTKNVDCEECPLPLVYRVLCAVATLGAAILFEYSFIYLLSKHAEQLPSFAVIIAGIFMIFVGYNIYYFSSKNTRRAKVLSVESGQLAI